MMPTSNSVQNDGVTYHPWVGFIFIFNLIVGTGALTLPAAFAKAGWLLSLIIIVLLALISYMTVTFIVEAMACANAVRNWQSLQSLRRSYDNTDNSEPDDDNDDLTDSLLPRQRNDSIIDNISTGSNNRISFDRQQSTSFYYNLNSKFELGEMAALFFNEFGRVLFFLCITIYLYGDLSIYSAAVAKSLRDVICDSRNSSSSNIATALMDNDDSGSACWKNYTLSRFSTYRLFLIGFTLMFGPLAVFSIQKTKYLQILTAIFRWLAFTCMIGIAIKLLVTRGISGHPPVAKINGLPSLFGACVYSFMCHHSLPSLLAPIRDKQKFRKIILYDYSLICSFYILLAMTGIFAFEHLQDLYTLNFIPLHTSEYSLKVEILIIIEYFLALFPVFTLSASYPIIAITLRNNLQSLFLDMTRFDTYGYFTRIVLFPVCAVLPPFMITFFTESVTNLVAFTGSYAGAGIQYLIPISIVFFARRTCTELLGNGLVNDFHSPFRNQSWLVFVLLWCLACVCLVTVDLFLDTENS